MAARDFEKAQAYLQAKSASGVSLYDHLSEVLLKIITEKPDDAVGVFEHISALAKQGAFTATAAREGGESKTDAPLVEAQTAWAAACEKKLAAPEPADGVDEAGDVQDLTEQSTYLEWAGVSLGATESFRLHRSLLHLAASTSVRELRFWGKILGTSGDYIIAEGRVDEEGEEGAKDGDGIEVEMPGVGANSHAYWVCSFAGGDWTRLPNVTPDQVRGASSIRRFFTGDLEANVGGHPPFPGKEKNYLRAQIARITAASVLVPAGLFEAADEDNPYEISKAEEFEMPPVGELGSWVHHRLPLNKLGRTTPNPPAVDEEGEPIEDPDAPEAPAALASIEEEEGQWSIRSCPAAGLPEGAEPAVVAVRSLAWPGAVTVNAGKGAVSVYVGYGQPHADAVFAPAVPADVAGEYNINEEEKEFREQVEVTVDPDEGKAEGEGEEGEGEDE